MGNERYLSAAQSMRADQLRVTHKSLSALADATSDAIKYHDKYVAALSTLTECLLDCSDAVEQTRTLLGPGGTAVIPPTFEVTGRLERLFEDWKGCVELLKMKEDLNKLAASCTMAKRNLKNIEKKQVKVMECASRRAKDAAYLEKLKDARFWSSTTRKRKERFDALQGSMQELDNDVVLGMTADGTWWAGRLAEVSQMLADDAARLGCATARCFAPQQPASPAQSRPATAAQPAHAGPAAGPPQVSLDYPYGTTAYTASPPPDADRKATNGPQGSPGSPFPTAECGVTSPVSARVGFPAPPPLFGNLGAAHDSPCKSTCPAVQKHVD